MLSSNEKKPRVTWDSVRNCMLLDGKVPKIARSAMERYDQESKLRQLTLANNDKTIQRSQARSVSKYAKEE